MAKHYNGSRLLGRARVAASNFAGALILWSAALTVLLWTSGCTGMVSGSNKTQSAIQVVPGALDFGNVGVGKQASHAAAVVNNSKTVVTLTKPAYPAPSVLFPACNFRFPCTLGRSRTS